MYKVDGQPIDLENLDSNLIETEADLKKYYNDLLDQVYGTTMIAGKKYRTSYALELVDSVKYTEDLADYIDSQNWLLITNDAGNAIGYVAESDLPEDYDSDDDE